MKTKVKTTEDQFAALHTALDKVRSNSLTVKVEREALSNLLQDFSALLDAVQAPVVIVRASREPEADTIAPVASLGRTDGLLL